MGSNEPRDSKIRQVRAVRWEQCDPGPFGRVLPALARTRQVIAFEQQGYGLYGGYRRSALQL